MKHPSGGMAITTGHARIEGFAWSGTADSPVDCARGVRVREARLEEPCSTMLTRFRLGGTGREAATIASSAWQHRLVQPPYGVARSCDHRFVQHHNGIFPWSVSASGEVKNAIA